MQGNMSISRKKRAHVPDYVSPNQLTIAGFENPFDQQLNPTNRWVVLAHLIPWDEICNVYLKLVPVGQTGRPPLNPRIVIGSLIIKHMCNLDDRETVDQISENVFRLIFNRLCEEIKTYRKFSILQLFHNHIGQSILTRPKLSRNQYYIFYHLFPSKFFFSCNLFPQICVQIIRLIWMVLRKIIIKICEEI